MEKGGKSSCPFEEERRRIRNHIDDFLNGLKKMKNEFTASKLKDIEKLRMELRFLRTFVLFGNSSLDDFYERMSMNISKFDEFTCSLFYQDEDKLILAKYDMECLTPLLLKDMKSYLSLENDDYVAMTTEEKMFEYLFRHLHDLTKYCSYLLRPLMSEYKILRHVFEHLRDFYPILAANKTSTEYLYPRYQMIVDRVTKFCFDLWTGEYKQEICGLDHYLKYGVSQCSCMITSLLIDIIPVKLEVLYICTSKLMKESSSTEVEGFVKKILKVTPRILQNYLILLQRRMAGVIAVNYAPTQGINIMMEFLLIFLIDIPMRFIHRDKFNHMLAHVGVLTRKISILVSNLLEESSENNINEVNFSAPDLLQEIEQMKGDIRLIFMKAPESSQLHFPMDDGLLFMNFLLRHLNDLLISNVYLVSLIKKEIGMVKESLEFLRSSLGKVRQRLDDTSGVVKDCWLRALDVAYEAEHVINSILVRDNALSHLIFSLPRVTDKIKLIVDEVTCLQLEVKNGDDPLDAKSSDEPIESTSSSFVEVTVGHEEDEAWIIDQLLDEYESELDVILIVGMPGLGKTTLANKVYKNTLVASHFNVRAWCTVSQKYNRSKVLLEILQQVTGSEKKESEDYLAENLQGALYDKRYLIVLDDVWDIATGKMLVSYFPKVKRGNRIIITSRSSEVGDQDIWRSRKLKLHVFHLQLLTPEKSWKLFEKKVFGDQGSCPDELSEVGYQIVEKCQGLPLALVLIAGVVVRGREGKKKEKEKDLWLKIQHNLDSFFSANNNLQMMKVMQLSYDHLPCHLKPLLLYLARSRKSKRTPVVELMQLLIAEGLVDHDVRSKSSLEEVTHSYLDALISRSLIMMDHIPCESSKPFSVMIKACYVHDVVHDFCSLKAKKEKFFKFINSGAPFHASDFLHRRLTIHTDDKICVLFNPIKSRAGSKNLISLRVRGWLDPSGFFFHISHLELVRVLQLDNIILRKSLTEEIGSLFHLRFLRIRTRDVKTIPLSWMNLQNLETLFIETEHPIMVLLPRILKLSKLKHVSVLHLSSFFEVNEKLDIIMDQPSRILEAENSKLEDLTTLSHVLIPYSEGTNDALEKFPNLQHLQCTIMEPKDSPTHGDWFPKLDVLNKLESLIATYQKAWADNDYYDDPDVIDKIPPPIEYHFPSSLKELRLYGFPLRAALLSAIAAFPQLEILEIINSDFIEDMWDASEDIYQSLKTLHLKNVNLSEWQVDRKTFPKLEELILKHCNELTEIPSAFRDIDTLKSIRVVQINRELGDSAMEIKKDVASYIGEETLHVYNYSSEQEGEEELPFVEERRRIRNHIDDFLSGLKKMKNEFTASKLDDIDKLRMELRFLRTFVLFGNSSLDDFYSRMSKKIDKFDELTCSLFYQDELILVKYGMECLAPQLLEEMKSYLSLENDYYVAMTAEEKMFEYLHDLPKYCSYLLLPLMSDYKILRQVFRHLRDFYPILKANKTSTEYLYPWFQVTADSVTKFCFDLWTGEFKRYYDGDKYYYDQYDVSECSSIITSLLIDIIPLELEVLYICTSKLMNESRSTELEKFVKQILKASPRILQNYLILIQERMADVVPVNCAPTQSINVMMEFLLIFLTGIPKRFIHREKLNDMLAHAGLLTRKISILVKKLLEEGSENNINESDFSAPDLLQEIEQMKGDIRQFFLKAPESSQLRFPMDDGFLFMNLLLRHLNDLLISNVCSVVLIKKEIGMVKESLEFLRSFFRKVRQTLEDSSGVVKDCWLRALDVAYETEHVINSILVRDNALSHLIFSLPSVTDKIKLIVAEVTSLQLEDKNGDHPLEAKSSDEPIESTSSSFVEVTVGHEEEEAWIIDQLLDEHESELDVISIVGMPGLGKTTLANKVYKNTLVASHFNIRVWCTISQKYNKSNVLREILQQVTVSEEKEEEGDKVVDLAEKLRRALLEKRYLIVLDDVWDIATGEMLIACFPKVKRGNRIILTSRSSKVGLQVKCRTDPLHLQLLTPEKSWELLVKKVFGDQGSCRDDELSEVGHQIVEKCQGLPLAVVLIAGVIVRVRKGKEKEKDLWLKIQHNMDSFISGNNNLQMMKVMQLSYDHLPYHLKPLLLYFARSQKSKRTPVSKLMQLWMAEGFVDHDIPSKSSLEEVTQSYLDSLIFSSLIMVEHSWSESNRPFSDTIKAYYVHDIVHDFCSVKAKKEKFFKLMNSGAPFHASDFLHRRLTIHTDDSQFYERCVLFNSNKSSAGSKHLISLKVSGSPNYSNYFCQIRHLRFLRVLQLCNTSLGGSSIEELGSLFHLRFLKIQADIKDIPLSWWNLQNLETLLIETEHSIMRLLPIILRLSKLKHVSIDKSSFFEVDDERNIIMDQPSRIFEAENSKLTTLSQVLISYAECTNDALEKFPNLQHLHCIIVEPKYPPTHGNWFPKLDVLNKLESLIAIYQLKVILGKSYRDQIQPPNEYYFPTSLKELRLNDFPLRPALLSAIVALPQLEILEFINSDFKENKWDASEDTYQSLKTLRLKHVVFSEWQVDRETFPKLEELILESLLEKLEIPSAFCDIETLKSIRVTHSYREIGDSAIEIKKDVAAYTGEDRLDVHISDVYERRECPN